MAANSDTKASLYASRFIAQICHALEAYVNRTQVSFMPPPAFAENVVWM